MSPHATVHIKCAIRLAIVLVFLAPPFALAQVQSSRIIFDDRFDGVLKPQWSANHAQISTTPVGQQHYLGPFGGESVLLNLMDLPDHQLVRLSMDVLIIGSWSGNAPVQGPDVLYIFGDDGRLVYGTSFGWSGAQAFPGLFSIHTASPGSGAAAINTLGFRPRDGIFHIECDVPHRGKSIGFRFLATTLVSVATKAWGILNARVTLEEPAAPNAAALLQAWDQLASDSPAASVDAARRLISVGEPAAKFLSQMLGDATIPQDIELLDPARASNRRRLSNGSDGFEIANSAQRRSAMAKYVLQVIGSDTAKDTIGELRYQQPDNMKTISLTVRNKKTRQPVPFIPITVNSETGTLYAAIVTDSSGQAAVNVPAETARTVRFQNAHAVYMPTITQMGLAGQSHVEILIERAAIIGGVVVDNNQKPVAGATVMAFASERQTNSAKTDQLGRWTMDLIPEQPNSIHIGVHSPDDPDGPIEPIDFIQELSKLHAGTLTIIIPHQETLHAMVVDAASGKPVERVHVSYSLVRQGRQMSLWQPLSADVSSGSFEVPIPPNYDAVSIRVEAEDYVTATSELISRDKMHVPLEMKLRTQIVEILLEDPANQQAKSYLDLDDGKTFAYGESTPENFVESRRWINENGVDLMCETRQPAEGLVAYDMVVIPTDTPIDRQRDYDELKKLLDESHPESFRIISTPPGLMPKTYIFRTREGVLGVLEAIAAIENSKGLKLRYKVVQRPSVEPNSPAIFLRQQQDLQILVRDLQTRMEAQQNDIAQLRQTLGENNPKVGAMHLQLNVTQQMLEAAITKLMMLRPQQLEQQRALVGQQPAFIGQQTVQPQLQPPRIPPAQNQAAKQPEAAPTTNPIRSQIAP